MSEKVVGSNLASRAKYQIWTPMGERLVLGQAWDVRGQRRDPCEGKTYR